MYFRQTIFFVFACFATAVNFFLRNNKIDKEVWLIGECYGENLKDNGYWLFKYCRRYYPDKAIYFVISKKSIRDDDFLRNEENVICYGSVRHATIFIQSNVRIFTVGYKDIAYKTIFRLFDNGTLKVFLQHGILGLKRMEWLYNLQKNTMDMFCVSSEFEKEIVDTNFEFSHDTTTITGLPRYDNLSKSANTAKNNIVYIPTWRELEPVNFGESSLYKRILNLTRNKKLNQLLEKHSVVLTVYPHRKVSKFFPLTSETSKNIRIFNSNDQYMQDIIVQNSLLITDYSSVSWDFFYTQKPVIFYQFDQEKFIKKIGSYLNLKSDLFGDVCTTEKELVKLIEKFIVNKFCEDTKYSDLRKRYFQYFDQNNCQRVFEEISNRSNLKIS